MFNFFGYLRAKVRESILGGVADALDELDQDESPDLDGLRKRLAAVAPAKAIAAARAEDEGEPAKGRGKGKG